jgi:hypothetical protein
MPSLVEEPRFRERWRRHKPSELADLGVVLTPEQWDAEWHGVLSEARRAKTPLDLIHVFALVCG